MIKEIDNIQSPYKLCFFLYIITAVIDITPIPNTAIGKA